MWESESSASGASAKVKSSMSSFEENALEVEVLVWFSYIQFGISELMGKYAWKIRLHMAGHPLTIHQMTLAYID